VTVRLHLATLEQHDLADRSSHLESDAGDARSLMDRGFAVGNGRHSMFGESLASSERILGATNAQRPPSPSWVRRDVPSTHIEASRGLGALTSFEKSHSNVTIVSRK